MTYQSENMALAVVMEVYRGKMNDVLVCEDERAKGTYYTVLRITDHGAVKAFLTMLERYPDKRGCVIDLFGCEGAILVVMAYRQERHLLQFYGTGERSAQRAERIGMNLVAACIGSELPPPLLELALAGRQVHLRQDDGVDIGSVFDLEQLNPQSGERECVAACAKLVRELLGAASERHIVSLALLNKKIPLQAYGTFRELYQDLQLSAVKTGRRGIGKRLRDWGVRNEEGIFRVLLWISLFLLLLVVIMVLSNVIFGDIPFMRLFFNSFKRIGTESMLQ